MAKSAERRIGKYSNKVDATVIAARITAQKADMILASTIAQGALVQMETAARNYLQNCPVITSPTQLPAYYAFARQCFKISNSYSGTLANSVAQHRADFWESEGLDIGCLIKLAALQGLTVT